MGVYTLVLGGGGEDGTRKGGIGQRRGESKRKRGMRPDEKKHEKGNGEKNALGAS